MTRDYMDRPVELLLMDAFLTACIEHIARLQDAENIAPLILVLGVFNTDKIVSTHQILADAEKCAAQNVVSRAQGAGYIDIRDWRTIVNMIKDMGTKEDIYKWN